MIRYILIRVTGCIITSFVVVTIVFLIMQYLPGDPVHYLLRGYESEGQVEALRKEFNLDKPIYNQYYIWIKGLLNGNLGFSIFYQKEISSIFIPRFIATIELISLSLFLSIILGIPLGIISAVRVGSFEDGLTGIISLIGVSTPVFVFGVILQIIFCIYLNILPTIGRVSIFENIFDSIKHLILPVFSISLGLLPYVIRNVRSEMLEVLKNDYIRTGWAKGLSPFKIYYKHALRNSLVGTIAVLGINFGMLLGGSVVTELVFQWPGLGTLFIQALMSHDYQLIQVLVLVYALMFTLVNLIVDVIYSIIDPRIALE